MNIKIKRAIFSLIALWLVFILIGCSDGNVKLTEQATEKSTEPDTGYSWREVEKDRFEIHLNDYEYYKGRFIAQWNHTMPDPIYGYSFNHLHDKIKNLSDLDLWAVYFFGDEGTLIIDFNEFYVPVLPENMCLYRVELRGGADEYYVYRVFYGENLVFNGDGSLNRFETQKIAKGDWAVIYFNYAEDDIDYWKDVPVVKNLSEGDKHIEVRKLGDDLGITVTKGEERYFLICNHFEYYEELPSDEWFLSFDMVKYLPE